jgi:hypothetical protein
VTARERPDVALVDVEDWQSSIDILLRRFAEYHDLEGAFDRSSADVEARVCEPRERAGRGPWLIAGETGVAHSTVPRDPALPRPVTGSSRCQGLVCALRVAVPRRSVAHGRQSPPAVSPSRARGHRRSLQALPGVGRPLEHDYFHAVVSNEQAPESRSFRILQQPFANALARRARTGGQMRSSMAAPPTLPVVR